jgi:hypothetical protein
MGLQQQTESLTPDGLLMEVSLDSADSGRFPCGGNHDDTDSQDRHDIR